MTLEQSNQLLVEADPTRLYHSTISRWSRGSMNAHIAPINVSILPALNLGPCDIFAGRDLGQVTLRAIQAIKRAMRKPLEIVPLP